MTNAAAVAMVAATTKACEDVWENVDSDGSLESGLLLASCGSPG